MARRFKVEGTKNYLIAAVILYILAAWFIWDGWFPRESVLEKHPDVETDSFYLFNKSMAIIFVIAAVVCSYIHLVVR